MSVEQFTGGLEPLDPDARIWRFMELWKFQDLISTASVYFCRADIFERMPRGDQNEGLPPEGYFPSPAMNPLDIKDALELSRHIGSVAQNREGFFVNCWYLANEPTAAMWQQYGHNGIAIASRYSRLKAALAAGEHRGFLGLVRYGTEQMTGWNVLRFISTKREEFAHEKEVRALLWLPNAVDGDSRHFDDRGIPHRRPLTQPPVSVPEHKRLSVDLDSLVEEVEVSPWASVETLRQVQRVAGSHDLPVRWSTLAPFKELIATEQDLRDLLRERGKE